MGLVGEERTSFQVKLIGGEVLEGAISGIGKLNFLWQILKDGWIIKDGKKCRMISPYRIKEILWDE